MRSWRRYVTLAAMLLAVALGSHWALEQTTLDHKHATHGALAVCILLFALFGRIVTPAPPPGHGRRVRNSERAAVIPPPVLRHGAVCARASPAWLQRFQN